MEGFRAPIIQNFVPDRVTGNWWNRRSPLWQCAVCGTPGITDRTAHNQSQKCRPIAWLDPIGVMVETVYALWGPDAPVSVRRIIPEIPAGKTIKVKELPYFTKDPLTERWMVLGIEEFTEPGMTVAVNRRAEDPQEVVIVEWMYQKQSEKTGNRYVMATFKRPWEV